MAPKRAPKQFMVGEVRCSITKDDNITVRLGGTNALSSKTVMVHKRKEETKEAAVARRMAQMASDDAAAAGASSSAVHECCTAPRTHRAMGSG
jgi:hypothetical protein